ncbi:MAG: transporter permease subunit [Actinomycetota bacterium]|nr:transporter permease subunit [Actinomycetota bacterium]
MTTTTSPPRGGFGYRHPNLRLAGLLTAPMAWLVVVYLGSLAALFITAFWTVDDFTGKLVREFTLQNFQQVFTTPAYLSAMLRTLSIALLVTLFCLVLALPLAFFMARVANPKWRPLLVALVLTPLWASYLVKVYAWRAMLQPETGVLAWFLDPLGLDSPGYGYLGIVITLTYLWLPYMILPIYAGLTRLPDSMLAASADLGARNGRTFRSVVMPLVFPSIVAGSIFTFSLSLGDYITAQIVGGKVTMLGNIVQTTYVTNLPFAAAVATIPVIIVLLYLLAVRRSGALDNL